METSFSKSTKRKMYKKLRRWSSWRRRVAQKTNRLPSQHQEIFETLEQLEPRVLMTSTLLGVSPSEPLFQYDNQGAVVYDAANDTFDVNATPLLFRESSGSSFVPVTGTANLEIHIEVDETGRLVGGVAGDDLVVQGSVDVDGDAIADYTGTLLTGEILAFGAENTGATSGATDQYDFRFQVTGGSMSSLYAGKDIGITTASEQSDFADDFTVNFGGEAKGNLGAIDPLPASLGDFVWEDLDGDGIQDAGEPGVGGVTVNLKDAANSVIDSTTTAADGSYSFTGLAPGTYSVQFVEPAGFDFTLLNAGANVALDSDADPAMNGMTDPVTLVAGENNTTLDAGLVPEPPLLGKLGDLVWNDVDMDGIQDAGEAGIEGVRVQLRIHNGTRFVGLANTTTDATGMYMFGDLEAGRYQVRVFGPDGFVFSPANQGSDDAVDSDQVTVNTNNVGRTGNINLAAGETNLTIDFGLYEEPQLASLGDFVWEDLDGDGIQDAGEPGVGGVTVNLKDAANSVIDSTTTAADGSYSFTGLAPGTYSVQFVEPAGFDFTLLNAGANVALDSDADPAMNGMTDPVTLVAGENNTTLDAGLVPEPPLPASLGDFVWEDLDGDGIQDAGEPGVGGVTVNLKDAANSVIDSTTTAADGSYSFTGLAPGTYSVQFVEPAGFDFTLLNAGANVALDSDADPAMNGMTDPVTLVAGENNTTLDAGLVPEPPLPASLGDFVWEDLDGDGIQDAGEPGVGGVTVNLKDAANSVIDSTTTAADGSYSFTGLAPGTYSVQFVEPAGFDFTLLNAGANVALDSDADPAMNGMTDPVTLVAGENNTTLDAGLVPEPPLLGKLGDLVWNDVDMDGIQDAGEAGIEGVRVQLRIHNGTRFVGLANTTTDATGMYMFGDLEAGRYQVRVFGPDGFVFSPANQGSDDAVDSDQVTVNTNNVGRTGNINLAAGETNLTIDFGLYEEPQLASLGDFVWEDLDGDGIQDAGEPGVGGVTVNLKDAANSVIDSTTTAADGSYSFTGLAPGTYSVQFVEPAGFDFTLLNAGANVALDSDADPAMNGMTDPVTLVAGENNTTLDAGLVPEPPLPASLGDFVWEDLDGDGIQDAGEPGVGGVTVNLKDAANSVIDSTTTAADGSYSFTGLAPGTYSVQFVEPAGFDFTLLNAGANVALDSDADPAMNGMTDPVTLVAGENNTTLDAGLVPEPPLPASLGDFVWEDLDGDGIQDAGEPGVGGVTVNLKDAANSVIDSTTTAADGSYSFTGLAPGTYSVQFVEPAGFDFTLLNAGANVALDSDADPAMNGMTDPVTLVAGENNTTLDAGLVELNPNIDIEKLTNGFDADDPNGPDVPEIAIGDTVTWTYLVTNTGQVPFDFDEVEVVDDNGTPGDVSDDFIPAFVSPSDVGGDLVLSPGEVWEYTFSDVAQDLTVTGPTTTFQLTGNSALDGPNGNIRTFTANGISVNASAFSRTDSGTWSTAFLGTYSEGLGVTDTGEGDGRNGTHRVDNIGRDNYVLFEFSETVVVDQVFLDSVVNDSDITVWIGTVSDPINNHITLSDAVLSGFSFEINETTSSSARLADVNPGQITGNVLVVAASTVDETPEDRFKIREVKVQESEPGFYKNTAVVTAGDVTDMDMSSYRNQTDSQLGKIGDRVWNDVDMDGIQDADEPGISGVTVRLIEIDEAGGQNYIATTTTDANGMYMFSGLDAGDYQVAVITPNGFVHSAANQGNDALDSDLTLIGSDGTFGKTNVISLAQGEINNSIDAGLYEEAATGKIKGTVYYDKSGGYGVFDAYDQASPNCPVYLDKWIDGRWVEVGYMLTDDYGNYCFEGLEPGTYRIDIPVPYGYDYTYDGPDHEVGGNGYATVDLTSGEIADVDAGFLYRYY